MYIDHSELIRRHLVHQHRTVELMEQTADDALFRNGAGIYRRYFLSVEGINFWIPYMKPGFWDA